MPTATVAARRTVAPSASPPPLPPSPQPPELQVKVAAQADTVVRAVQSAGLRGDTKYGQMVERMIRAALLDPAAYRQAAEDEAGTPLAAQAAVVAFLLGAVGPYLLQGRLPGVSDFIYLALTVAAQLVSFAAGALAISYLAPKIAGVTLSFGQVFRPMAYAQSPTMLRIIPTIGTLLSIWTLLTAVAALREINGGDTGKAVILMLVGFVGSLVAAAVATPIILGIAAAFVGGY